MNSERYEIGISDFSFEDVYLNLALEDILINEVSDGKIPPLVRVWSNPVSVVMGLSRPVESDVFTELIAKDSIRLARRTSGGGTVYHDHGTLLYSFFFPWKMIGFENDPKSVGDSTINPFLDIVIDMLGRFDLKAIKSGVSDIFVDRRKISGNAQKRKKGAILHHGTILQNVDLDRMTRYLKIPPERKGISHSEFVTSLHEIGVHVNFKTILERMIDVLNRDYRCYPIELMSEYPYLIDRAKSMAEDSLRKESWIFRR